MRAVGIAKLLCFYAIMAAVAAAAMWQCGDLALLAPAPALGAVALGLGLGLGSGLVIVGGSRSCTRRFSWARRLEEEFRALVGPLDGREVLALALWSGLAEEMLFRGVLMPALGLWLSAAIFAILHIGPTPRFLPWTAMAFGVGLWFGGLLLFSGSLLAPVLAHVTVNLLNLRFLAAPAPAAVVHLEPVGGEQVAGP